MQSYLASSSLRLPHHAWCARCRHTPVLMMMPRLAALCRYVLSHDKRLQRLKPFSHSPVTWFRNPYAHIILVSRDPHLVGRGRKPCAQILHHCLH